MTVSLGALKTRVLGVLSKENNFQGFYTDAQIHEAVNDSLEYIYTKMMYRGEGWLYTIDYLNTVANTRTVALPSGVAVVHAVRYLDNEIYRPVFYDDQSQENQTGNTDQQTFHPFTYRLVGNNIYFDPVPSDVGNNYVQIEYTSYPARLVADNDDASAQLTNGLINFVKWRAASICRSLVGEAPAEWQRYQNEWQAEMEQIIARRIRETQTIKRFRTPY